MPKISDYQTTESPKDSDVLLVQTTEHGTRKIKYGTIMSILLGGDQNASN